MPCIAIMFISFTSIY